MVFRVDLIMFYHDSSMGQFEYMKIFDNWLGIWILIPQEYTHNSHSNHIDYVTMKVGLTGAELTAVSSTFAGNTDDS